MEERKGFFPFDLFKLSVGLYTVQAFKREIEKNSN